MANFLETITKFLTDGLAQAEAEPRLPTVLEGLEARVQELLQFSSGLDGSGIEQWLARLNALIGSEELRDTLYVRALQLRLPRLLETLTFLGIVEFVFEADGAAGSSRVHAFKLHRARLSRLLQNPGGYAADLAPDGGLGTLLSRVQKIKDLKALQVLGLMLLASPLELLKLDYRKEGFTGLPLEGEPGVTLQELMALINSPLRLPLPFRPPLSAADLLAQAGPAAAGDQGYVALLGPDGDGEDPANSLQGLGLELHLNDQQQAAQKSYDLGGGWFAGFTASANGATTFVVKLDAANKLDTTPNPAANGDFGIYLTKRAPGGGDAVVVGASSGTHFKIQTVRAGLRLRSPDALFDLLLALEQMEFVLKADFLRLLQFGLDLPGEIVFGADLDVSYVQGKGLSGQGNTGGLPGLNVQFAKPINLQIGSSSAGLQLDQVLVQLEAVLRANGFRYRASIRYGASARLGPLSAVMEGAGAWVGRWTDGTAGLIPPQGIGVTLAAGPVNGGGFLRVMGPSDFAGALQLKVLGIGAFAYGLYKALPSGDPSFVALIGIRLPLPGIQLGFGFAVSGFGGLVGINRRADTDRLRERLTSGAAGDVLFNDNPVENAPRLLGDMQQFFPEEKGVFLVGPTLQINWLYLIKLDVAVVVELPGPRKIFIAGSARMIVGSEDFALVYLRMDFIGGIDLTKSLIFFDAALVNSHVLGIFRITGGMALRIAYGPNGYFLFSVGGFHPSFNPGALEVPKLPRVGTSVDIGIAWIKFEMYLALTSNTFQLGSRVEAGVEIGPISAHGWFGFDALIQFEPFHFVATVDAGFDVEVAGVSLCGVHVHGQLSGPGPLMLNASASVEILFFEVSADVTITLSDNPASSPPAIPDVLQHLKGELSKPANLRAEGSDTSVLLAPAKEDGPPNLFAPISTLIWEQKRAPLDLAIQRLEGVELGAWHTLHVTSGAAGETPEEDWFGVGTYLQLSDGEALNSARFAKQHSGVRVGAGALGSGPQAPKTIAINLVKIEAPVLIFFPGLFLINQFVVGALAEVLRERTGGARPRGGEAAVTVTQEAWKTQSTDGAWQTGQLNEVQALVHAKRFGTVALPAVEKVVDLAGVF